MVRPVDEEMEALAAEYRAVSFTASGGTVSLLISCPLVGNTFELGCKIIGHHFGPSKTFLKIPYADFLGAGRGTLEFDCEGRAKVRPIKLGRS